MSCNMHCNKFLSYVALGFSIILSDKKLLSVTVFDDPLKDSKVRIRITRKKHKPPTHWVKNYNYGIGDFTVTIGRPNYMEREFLAKCKKAKCHPRRYWINKIAK